MKCPHCNKEIETDFQTVKYEKKEFRIYKWSKPVKEFAFPKDFELAEEKDLIDMHDNDLIKLEKYPAVYFTKNRSKKNIKLGWDLSRGYVGRNGGLGFYGGDLGDSDDAGRVCFVKKINNKNGK